MTSAEYNAFSALKVWDLGRLIYGVRFIDGRPT